MVAAQWPDVELYNDTLPDAGAEETTLTLEDVGRYSRIVLFCEYTAATGSSDAQPILAIDWLGDDGEWYPAVQENSAGDGFEAQTRLMPATVADATTRMALPVENFGGTHMRLRVAESGDTDDPGDLIIRASPQS